MPCPATTAGSSNGWQNALPSDSARACAATIASARDSPPSTTRAPYPRHASIFVIGAPAGTKMSHGTPKYLAANAIAWAWLPALPAVTPARACDPSEASLFIAPRILKAPVRWRFSALSTTGRPNWLDRTTEETTGVCLATAPATSRAARISARVTESTADGSSMRTATLLTDPWLTPRRRRGAVGSPTFLSIASK